MTESQFIIWLKGYLSGKSSLDNHNLRYLRNTLEAVKSPANESSLSHGKQILHD